MDVAVATFVVVQLPKLATTVRGNMGIYLILIWRLIFLTNSTLSCQEAPKEQDNRHTNTKVALILNSLGAWNLHAKLTANGRTKCFTELNVHIVLQNLTIEPFYLEDGKLPF